MIAPLVLLAAVALTVTPPAKAGHAESYTHFLRAKAALAADDPARAIDEYSQARDLDPTSATIRIELADVLLRLRRYRDAAREAEQAVVLDPKGEAGLDLLAQIQEAMGEIDNAIATLKRLGAVVPAQASYLVRMASLEDRAGRPEEAVKLLEQAVARDPSATEAVFELVERFQGLGRLDRAIDVLERAAQADPDNLYLRSKLAELFVQIRDEGRAKKALDSMVEVAPSNLHMLLEVARAFRQMDDDARAATIYRQALALKPGDDAIRVQLATSLTRAGDLKAALVEYRALLAALDAEKAEKAEKGEKGEKKEAAASPAGAEGAEHGDRKEERYEFLKRIGILELELGNVKAALPVLEEARASAPPDDLDLVRGLARAYDRSEQPAKGLALYEERLTALPAGDLRGPELKIGKAAFLILSGEVDPGLKLYREVSEAQPLELRQHGVVAYALMRRGRVEEAERVLAKVKAGEAGDEQRAYGYVANLLVDAKQATAASSLLESLLARNPLDREVYLFLARTHARGDANEEAAKVLERGVKALPRDPELHFSLGATYERLKRPADSDRELEAAIAIDPKHGMAMNYLAYMLAERGEKLERALELGRRAVSLDPDNGAFLDTLGWVHFKLGQLEPARVNLEKAVAAMAEDPVVREHLGDVLAKKGDAPGALRSYERAVALAGAQATPALREKLARAKSAPGAMAPEAAPVKPDGTGKPDGASGGD